MAKGLFDDAEIDVPCPGCGQNNKQTMRRLQNEASFTCVGCNQVVALENEELRRNMEQLNKSWNDMLRSFDKFGKK